MLFQENGDLVCALFMGLILSSIFLLFIGGFAIKIFQIYCRYSQVNFVTFGVCPLRIRRLCGEQLAV